MTEQDTGPPPQAALIRIAREAKGWSPETAAAHMPFKFSGSSWRQIEAGYRGRDRTPRKARPAVLAAMARTVGVTSDRMQEHNPEAAEIMREMERQEAQQAPVMPEALRNVPAHVKRMIDAALEDVDPADVPEVLRQMAADYEADQARRQRPSGPQRPRRTG